MTNEGAISGRIADRSVADLFQWLHESRATGAARFRTALGTATVWVRDGELYDAEMGRFAGDAAVLRLMRIQDGEYELELKAIARRRTIKSSTPQLLAEGQKRAPRPGRATGPMSDATAARVRSATPAPSARGSSRSPSHPPTSRSSSSASSSSSSGRRPRPASGEYSHVGTGIRDDSRPRRRRSDPPIPAAPDPTAPAKERRHVDSGAHTLLAAKAVPRRPTAGGPEAAPASTPARGPSARRRVGWSPTADGPPPEPTPSTRSAAAVPGRPVVEADATSRKPEPDALAKDEEVAPPRSRTRFMFGVTGPGAVPAPPPGSAEPPAAPRFAPTGTPSRPELAAPATPLQDDSGRMASESRRRRSRAAARAQVPFELERADRTLLRPGPLPPPPGQPVVLPASPSQPIQVAASASVPAPRDAAAPVPLEPSAIDTARHPASEGASEPSADATATPFTTPQILDEEFSHPISVPTAPNVGPGGTWMLSGPSQVAKPLPIDPTAEETVTMKALGAGAPSVWSPRTALDAVQPRPPSLSGHVKAGGTAHVGRYEVLLRLARGGMGTVYLCRVTGEGGFRRLFALKVIRDHLNTNQAYVRMLLEEARIASRLSHPNIVSIIDIDTFAGQHYLVMDYVEGCTFSELLKAHPKTRPPELLVPVVLDALTGLHAAHQLRGDDGSPHPVVHCDFSPHNMLVGVNGTCRITDFGVAKAANALPDGPGRGKPGYLSPEQVRGLPLDARSDVFSAGVVLWNALTGEVLFDGETPEQILHQVVSRPVPNPSQVGLRPPACFDRICLRALERDPAKRYQSAEDMLIDLRKVAVAQDLLAPSSEVGRWVQETFGAQIELRRQAAGLTPGPPAANAIALRDMPAAVGASGHGGGHADAATPAGVHGGGWSPEVSVTGHDANASNTMMLRADAARPGPPVGDEEGFGARTRVVVIVAALTFMGAIVITLFVRPELLQGGIIDESGQYVDLNETPPEHPLGQGGSTGGPAAVGGDESTGPLASAGGSDGPTDSGTDTGGDTEADTGTDGEDPAEPEAGDEAKGKGKGTKRGRGKGKGKGGGSKPSEDDDAKAPAKDPNQGRGKGKGKGDGGSTAPPPDLDELFKPPGG